jgi:hypothetical protein
MAAQDELTRSSDDSLFAQLEFEPQVPMTVSKAASPDTVFLKVAVSATAQNVRMKFDPVSVEEVRQTRELNRSIRLGFMPPTSSTR